MLPATIEAVAVSTKQTTLKVSLPHRHEMRGDFIDAAGAGCLLVLANLARYQDGEVPQPDRDAPELPLAADDPAFAEVEGVGAEDDKLKVIHTNPASVPPGYPRNKWAGGGGEPILSIFDDEGPRAA